MKGSSEKIAVVENDDEEIFVPKGCWKCERCGKPGPRFIDLTFFELDDTVWCVCPGCQDDLIVEELLTFTSNTLFENMQHLPEG